MSRNQPVTDTWMVAPYQMRTLTVKSKREAMMCDLLTRLVKTQDVSCWWYEPYIFRCKRLYRSEKRYTPDFLVALNADIFDTGTKSVWIEVKSSLDQNGKVRFHCLSSTYPWMKDRLLLMVDREPEGRSKSAKRQRILQDGALKWITRVLYATEWYPKFGIKR